MANPAAYGVGLATLTDDGTVLDTWFPYVGLDVASDGGRSTNGDALAALAAEVGHTGGAATHRLTADHAATLSRALDPQGRLVRTLSAVTEPGATESAVPHTTRVPVATFIGDLGDGPLDAHDVYLRLHLLSNRQITPHGASFDGAFGLLTNVVWTDLGPAAAEGFEWLRAELAASGTRVRVTSVDKFPRMTDYVVPTGVRIGDADRVRLGAHLADGTTVMHEGFVNFNAGTLGASMIEGRISAGVVVGDGSDLGGSASVMGTLSGGGTEVVRIGEGCLLGANAGVGISLGDGCVVEAGLYLTAGTRITLSDGDVVKARELSGRGGLLYRRDSESGRVVALPREGSWGELNAALHANN